MKNTTLPQTNGSGARYHARETAVMRAHLEDAIVVMGSATPSLQTLHRVAKNKVIMLRLPKGMLRLLACGTYVGPKQYKSAMNGPMAVPAYLPPKKL